VFADRTVSNLQAVNEPLLMYWHEPADPVGTMSIHPGAYPAVPSTGTEVRDTISNP
jgi:hypothetical protein